MQWDLGAQGLAVLAAISLGFALIAGLVVNRSLVFRMWLVAVTTAACFVVGVFTSEALFGWATEEDLQPNVDGLSRDEVLVSSLLTMVVVVLVSRLALRRAGERKPQRTWRVMGRAHGHHRHA
ncbi:MAG TPA: hypothetical protein VFK52_03955 [Nocardioidaceae bacterium]|nr:hypothetical protein [Nocardioidaceae bacterium]